MPRTHQTWGRAQTGAAFNSLTGDFTVQPEVRPAHWSKERFSSLLHYLTSGSMGEMSSQEVFQMSVHSRGLCIASPRPWTQSQQFQASFWVSSCPRLPYWLPSVSLLVLVVNPEKAGKLKWNLSCLCGSKLRVYAEKMSLAFDKATLEMPLSVWNRLEPNALAEEPVCWISPIWGERDGVIQMQGRFWHFLYHLSSEECRTFKAGVWIWLWRTGQI